MTITIKETDPELAHAAELSLRGEEVLLQTGNHLFRLVPCLKEPLIRPPGYFADDYTEDDIRESNATLTQTPQGLLQ
ncbi:MAG: hypothetical protein AAB466_03790 [Verrucomicrobiota bacterium]